MSRHIEYGLRYNNQSAEYLKSVNYGELVQWLMSEALVGVAKARTGEDMQQLELLEEPEKFLLELVKTRLVERDDEAKTLEEDLNSIGQKKEEAMQEGSKLKWACSRPSTAGPSRGASRPGTSPSTRGQPQTAMDQELKDLRGQRRTERDNLEAAQLRVHLLVEKLRSLKAKQGAK